MSILRFCVVAIAFLISGCATNYGEKPAHEVAKAITIKDSEFDSKITYIGPQAFSETRRGIFVDNETVQLVATKDKKDGTISFFVYTRILYSFDWRFYNSASFSDGSKVDARSLSAQVNSCTGAGCIHTEEVSFPVNIEALKGPQGLKYRLNSKSGTENIITISKNYADGFLSSLKQKNAI